MPQRGVFCSRVTPRVLQRDRWTVRVPPTCHMPSDSGVPPLTPEPRAGHGVAASMQACPTPPHEPFRNGLPLCSWGIRGQVIGLLLSMPRIAGLLRPCVYNGARQFDGNFLGGCSVTRKLLVSLVLVIVTGQVYAANLVVLRDSIGPDSSLTDGLPGGSTFHDGGTWNTPGLVIDVPETGELSQARFVIFARNIDFDPENNFSSSKFGELR